MTDNPEKKDQSRDHFPDDLNDSSSYFLARLIQFLMREHCPLTDADPEEVADYLEAHILSAIEQLGAKLFFYEEPFLVDGRVRVFFITHFKPEGVPAIKKILASADITWPLRVYTQENGERAINIVSVFLQQPSDFED